METAREAGRCRSIQAVREDALAERQWRPLNGEMAIVGDRLSPRGRVSRKAMETKLARIVYLDHFRGPRGRVSRKAMETVGIALSYTPARQSPRGRVSRKAMETRMRHN